MRLRRRYRNLGGFGYTFPRFRTEGQHSLRTSQHFLKRDSFLPPRYCARAHTLTQSWFLTAVDLAAIENLLTSFSNESSISMGDQWRRLHSTIISVRFNKINLKHVMHFEIGWKLLFTSDLSNRSNSSNGPTHFGNILRIPVFASSIPAL